MDYQNDNVVAFAIENKCQYKRPLCFPDIIEAGLCVTKVGNRSVRYKIGLFTGGFEEPVALGYFVHVFVNRDLDNQSAPIPQKNPTGIKKIKI